MTTTPYDRTFHDALEPGALSAANVILPVVFRLLSPSSVIDIGCGRGAWLKVCTELGVTEVFGIDGSEVAPGTMLIDPSRFLLHDLRRPLAIPRTADMAICLEVAEHLPLRCARTLVDTLVAIAPVVLFSAAVPGQGGTHHINEQWPLFWESLFLRHGYRRLDAIRRHVFQDERVPWWYQQNIVLFVAERCIAQSLPLQHALARTQREPMELLSKHVVGQFSTIRGLLRQTALTVRRTVAMVLTGYRWRK